MAVMVVMAVVAVVAVVVVAVVEAVVAVVADVADEGSQVVVRGVVVEGGNRVFSLAVSKKGYLQMAMVRHLSRSSISCNLLKRIKFGINQTKVARNVKLLDILFACVALALASSRIRIKGLQKIPILTRGSQP